RKGSRHHRTKAIRQVDPASRRAGGRIGSPRRLSSGWRTRASWVRGGAADEPCCREGVAARPGAVGRGAEGAEGGGGRGQGGGPGEGGQLTTPGLRVPRPRRHSEDGRGPLRLPQALARGGDGVPAGDPDAGEADGPGGEADGLAARRRRPEGQGPEVLRR